MISFGATFEHTVDGSFSERTMASASPITDISPPIWQHHRDPGRPQRLGRARTPRQHSSQLPCQWRRRDRLVLTAYERALKLIPAPRRAAQDHPLQLINDDLVRPHEGHGRCAGGVHDLRLLQRRQIPLLRRRPHEAHAWRSAPFLDAGIRWPPARTSARARSRR